MFRHAYLTAISITPVIEVKSNTLHPHEIDRRYLMDPYSLSYTDGRGSLSNPYTYKSAAPVSAYYGIVDLWFRFRPTVSGQDDIYIRVNDWVFKLTADGVLYEDQHIRFT